MKRGFQALRIAKQFSGHVARREGEGQLALGERPGRKAEVARRNRVHFDFHGASVVQRERVQQMGRRSKCHAGQQREIVAGLEETEMGQQRLV